MRSVVARQLAGETKKTATARFCKHQISKTNVRGRFSVAVCFVYSFVRALFVCRSFVALRRLSLISVDALRALLPAAKGADLLRSRQVV